MIDTKDVRRRIVAGFNDRNIIAGIVAELCEEVNRLNRTKTTMSAVAKRFKQ